MSRKLIEREQEAIEGVDSLEEQIKNLDSRIEFEDAKVKDYPKYRVAWIDIDETTSINISIWYAREKLFDVLYYATCIYKYNENEKKYVRDEIITKGYVFFDNNDLETPYPIPYEDDTDTFIAKTKECLNKYLK